MLGVTLVVLEVLDSGFLFLHPLVAGFSITLVVCEWAFRFLTHQSPFPLDFFQLFTDQAKFHSYTVVAKNSRYPVLRLIATA